METINQIDQPIAEVLVLPFDPNNYLKHSQNQYFIEGRTAYLNKEYEKALIAFKKADVQGNPYAASRLGILYHDGFGCTENREQAFQYFLKGSRNGCPIATDWLSEYYLNGYDTIQINEDISQQLYSENLPYLRLMSESGDEIAQYYLACDLLNNAEDDDEEKEAVKLYESSYKNGYIPASVMLAECYYYGNGVEKDSSKTLSLIMQHPEPKNSLAQYLLGLCNYHGEGTKKNLKRAFLHFKAAASLDQGEAFESIGDCYYNGDYVEQNLRVAAEWYKKAADDYEIGTAANKLAWMYHKGEGVEQDEASEMNYFLIAARNGVPEAQRIVGEACEEGRYFTQNSVDAYEWAELAAESGDAEAQLDMCMYCLKGYCGKTESDAFEWALKAADQRHPGGEFMTGAFYQEGNTTVIDLKKANYYFSRAVEDGDAMACFFLGKNYLNGNGIHQDVDKAVELLTKATLSGVEGADFVLSEALAIQDKQNLRNGNTSQMKPSVLDMPPIPDIPKMPNIPKKG